MTNPFWAWCPAPGAERATKLQVDIAAYGDGYTHRSTRGLNPVRPEWNMAFPFRTVAELQAMDAFLRTNAVIGFSIIPPDAPAELFVTCDEWSAAIQDRTGSGAMVGMLRAKFSQAFNPQPIP